MINWLEILAWAANIAFSLAAVPQVIKTIHDGHAKGLTWGLVYLWFFGEFGSAIVVWDKNMLPFLVSYLINTGFLCIIILYKLKCRYKLFAYIHKIQKKLYAYIRKL